MSCTGHYAEEINFQSETYISTLPNLTLSLDIVYDYRYNVALCVTLLYHFNQL